MGVVDAPGRVAVDPDTGSAHWPGWGERIYARFLRAYPRAFRARYADEMAILFGDQLREARRTNRRGAMASIWIRTGLDIGSSALGEHLRRDRDMAHSPATFEPTRTMRLLDLLGLLGGVLLLWAFISFNPFEARAANMVRLILFALGGAAIAIAFHGRQAPVAHRLATAAAGAVVVSGVAYATLTVLGLWVAAPFSGAFGTVQFWTNWSLWISAAVYGATMLRIGAAWRGMSRSRALAARIGAIALLGGGVARLGDDRLGLVDSATYGQTVSAVAIAGVALVGLGWVILGAVRAVGARGATRQA